MRLTAPVLLACLLSGCLLDERHIVYGTQEECRVYVMDQQNLERIWAKLPNAYGPTPRAFTWHRKIYLAATMAGSQPMLERQWGHEAMHNWVGRQGERLAHDENGTWDLTPLFANQGRQR